MSRDFLLVFGGGVVSLVTTLVVLFVTDWVYRRTDWVNRRDQGRQSKTEPVDSLKTLAKEKEN